MAGSGVVFSKNGMMNDGGGHLYVLCTWCFVLDYVNTTQSTKRQVQRSNTVSIQRALAYEFETSKGSIRSVSPYVLQTFRPFFTEE